MFKKFLFLTVVGLGSLFSVSSCFAATQPQAIVYLYNQLNVPITVYTRTCMATAQPSCNPQSSVDVAAQSFRVIRYSYPASGGKVFNVLSAHSSDFKDHGKYGDANGTDPSDCSWDAGSITTDFMFQLHAPAKITCQVAHGAH